MKKIIVSLAIAALTVAFAMPTQAAPKTGNSGNGSVTKSQAKPGAATPHNLGKGIGANKIANYHLQHGTKFDHGYFFKGKHHEHWGETRFDSRYGCNCYWDSSLSTWYYWCERDICYYPVSYCPYQCYVCPRVIVEPVRPIVVVQPVRPIVVVEPVRPIIVVRPVRPIIVVEPVRPIVVVEPVRPVVVVRPVCPLVVVQPVCEYRTVLACEGGASIGLGGVLRTGQLAPIHQGPGYAGRR